MNLKQSIAELNQAVNDSTNSKTDLLCIKLAALNVAKAIDYEIMLLELPEKSPLEQQNQVWGNVLTEINK